MALSRDVVVDAATRILETYGLADLTMRRVADELGVKAGALYWHVPNKQTLLASVADVVLADLRAPTAAGLGQWVGQWAAQLRRVLLERRDAAELVSSALATGLLSTEPAAALARRLAAAGLAEDEAWASARAVCHFVLGHVFQEQSMAQLAALGVVQDHDPAPGAAVFDAGVRLLTAGLLVDADAN